MKPSPKASHGSNGYIIDIHLEKSFVILDNPPVVYLRYDPENDTYLRGRLISLMGERNPEPRFTWITYKKVDNFQYLCMDEVPATYQRIGSSIQVCEVQPRDVLLYETNLRLTAAKIYRKEPVTNATVL